MSAPPSTETLSRLMNQKRRLLEQIVTLTRRQDALVASAETSGLIELLSGKQQLIAGLQSVERGLDAFRRDDPDERQWPDPAARAACRADSDACEATLREILEIEQRNQNQMQSRREEIADRLKSVQSAHVAASAYKTHLSPTRAPMRTDAPHDAASAAPLNLSTRD